MVRRSAPKSSLASDAANLAELRAMGKTERDRLTCGQCQVTYKTDKSVKACQEWHAGR